MAGESLLGGVVNPSVSFADSSLYTREPLVQSLSLYTQVREDTNKKREAVPLFFIWSVRTRTHLHAMSHGDRFVERKN